MKKAKNGSYELAQTSKRALKKFVRDLNKATKDMVQAGMDLSLFLTPKAAAHIHKRLGNVAARVDRISEAYFKLR